MKLYDLKNKYMSKLMLYNPKSDEEAQLVDNLIKTLHSLKRRTLPWLLREIHLILKTSSISSELKNILTSIVEDVNNMMEEK